MHVRHRDKAIGLDGALDHDRLAASVGRRRTERDALARNGIVDRVSRANHLAASFTSIA
jgi:hypothetical protein